jgi:glucosyl-dolichyl phosphate glucuronosyltransferase
MSSNYNNIMVSVVVCTLNRSLLLRKCLESLANQDISVEMYEVIVVDNGSTDDTAEVINEFLASYKSFRSMKEDQQGLSFSRNLGWNEAFGQYVAFIDDDAVAYPNWISGIANFIARQPDAGIFGGPYDAFYQVPIPAWFPPEYGKLDLGAEERCIKLGSEWISGSNMVIRKELFYMYGGFDERLGMTGGKAAYGEEVKFFLSMRDKGNRIFYVPSIRVAHLVAEYKMSLNWLLLSGYSVGRRYELTFNVNRSLLSHVVSLISELGIAVCRMLRPVNMPFRRRLYYSLFRLYYEAGAVIEHASSCLMRKSNDV